jgi:hypothetical protein
MSACFLSAVVGQFFLIQWANNATLLPGLFFFSVSLFLFHQTFDLPHEVLRPEKNRNESWLLALVFFAAIFFRFYQIGRVPSGISVDSGAIGLGGLRVLYDGWRPFFEDSFATPGLIYYLTAAWFHFFHADQPSLFIFFAVLSLIALIFCYWTFRQLAGIKTALIALLLLSVSRWDVAYSRSCPPHDAVLCMFATLGFWLYGLRRDSARAFYGVGTFLALGLYTYHGYKIFLVLMMVCGIYEFWRNPSWFKRRWKVLSVSGGIFLLLASPLLYHWVRQGGLGHYETGLFIGHQMQTEKSLWPLLENIFRVAFLFNRQGDPTAYCNFDSHRMLDDASGIFLILGFYTAIRTWRKRISFYALAGLGIMSLNCVLTTNAFEASGHRMFGTIPFVVLLAAMGIEAFFDRLKLVFLHQKNVRGGLLFFLLIFVCFQNFYQYFVLQAQDSAYYRESDAAATDVGDRILKEGKEFDFCLSPRYYGQRTILFLDYFQSADYYRMDYPKDLALAPLASGKQGLCFVLEEARVGDFKLLKTLYSRARTDVLRDLKGQPLVYYVYVTRDELESTRGMKWQERNPKFSFSPQDLPQPGLLNGTLVGNVFIGASGPWCFGAEPGAAVSFKVDGLSVHLENPLFLTRGFHSLKVSVRKVKTSTFRLWAKGPDKKIFILDNRCLTTLPLNRGLKAEYRAPGKGIGVVYSQWDPLVNFTHRTDLALDTFPLQVQWNGTVWCQQEGSYDFVALTEPDDTARIWLDGKSLCEPQPTPVGGLFLKRGWHSLRLEYQHGPGFFSAISLAWKKPGENHYEVIPPQCLGLVHE